MKNFYKEVDTTNREQMINFLSNHFRYNTMNSWNRSTSYANNVKLYNLPLNNKQKDALYRIMDIECDSPYQLIHRLLNEFGANHQYRWQAGFNGRSGGYVVLYEGNLEDGRIVTYPGRSIDMNVDFSEWDNKALQERVKLVQDFDKLCDDIIDEAIYIADNYEIQTVEVVTTKKVVRLKDTK